MSINSVIKLSTAKPVVYVNIPLDTAILPVRLPSAQKQNLAISLTLDETPEQYACAVTKPGRVPNQHLVKIS
jgi:hypothetical protein